MENVRIQTFEARYHLPPSAAGERARYDRLLPEVVGDGLDAALARHGIGPEEEVCLREIRVPIRLAAGTDDGAVVAAWSLALAASIREAIDAGGPGVVRYASRRDALIDCATRVARGDHSRAWAWAQLGLGIPPRGGAGVSARPSARDVVRSLVTEDDGRATLPVLTSLAANGALGVLAARLDADDWKVLAAVAAHRAGWPEEVLALSTAEPAERSSDEAEEAPETGLEARRLDAALRSRLLATALQRLPVEIRRAREIRRALAVLALVDAEPAPALDPDDLARRLAAVARGLDPESDAAGGSPGVDRAAVPPAGREPSRAVEPARGSAAESRDERFDDPEAEDPGPERWADRRSGETAWGGLPFLVALADGLGLPEGIAAEPRLAARPFRWSLHGLALALIDGLGDSAPTQPDDPAVLAFAGLPPGSEPPSVDAEPPSEEEGSAIRVFAERLVVALAERLEIDRSEESDRAALFERVAHRRATILGDPGWLEVHLSLADASTELRRARLDLDPGWVPWLGVVLRFVYE